jgi:hypothetical protein
MNGRKPVPCTVPWTSMRHATEGLRVRLTRGSFSTTLVGRWFATRHLHAPGVLLFADPAEAKPLGQQLLQPQPRQHIERMPVPQRRQERRIAGVVIEWAGRRRR